MERYTELDVHAAMRIAAVLETELCEATYASRGAVYELSIRSATLGVAVKLILWTVLRRADIRLGDSSLVFKRVDAIEIYPGVEVLFRRLEPPGYMFLSVGGRASMVV